MPPTLNVAFRSFERRIAEPFPNEELLTLKDAGGWNPPYAQEIGCNFSRNDQNVLKLPDFFKNDVGPKVKESFWAYLV